MAFGQTRQINAPTATTCKGTTASVSTLHLRHHQQPAGRHLADRQYLRRHLEPQLRRRHCGLHDLQFSQSAPQLRRIALRNAAYITASANSVTSNPVQVYVHAQVSSISLATAGTSAGAQQCYSQGASGQLDSEACFAPAARSMSSALPPRSRNYACPGGLPPGVTSVPNCSNSIGTLTYAVGDLIRGDHQRCDHRSDHRAAQPGTTAITASVAGSGSSAGYFSTCPPKSISVTLQWQHQWNCHPGRAAEPDDHRDRHQQSTHHRPHARLPVHQPAGYHGWRQWGGRAGLPGRGFGVCHLPAVHVQSIAHQSGGVIWYRTYRSRATPVNITTPGTASSYVWFSAPGQSQYFVPTICSRNAGIDGASALCSQFDGDGSARHHPLLRFVARTDDVQHREQRSRGNTEYCGSRHCAGGFSQQHAGSDQRPGPACVLLLNATGSVAANFTGVGNSAAGRRTLRPVRHRQRIARRQSLRHAVRLQRQHRVDHLRFVFVRWRNQRGSHRFPA